MAWQPYRRPERQPSCPAPMGVRLGLTLAVLIPGLLALLVTLATVELLP